MKLKNKETGEIVSASNVVVGIGKDGKWYDSIAGLNKDWEDVPEEPKEYWYIDWNGEVCRSDIHDKKTEQMKLIGNYFETEEETEKAVERLRAWKRLKDKGFRFKESNICGSDFSVCFSLEDHDDYQGSIEDFDKCFLR